MENTTVTYMGPNGVLIHTGPSGNRYMLHKRSPLVITDEQDIAFYRGKESKGSPFKVHPKLEYKPEPITKEPIVTDGILLAPTSDDIRTKSLVDQVELPVKKTARKKKAIKKPTTNVIRQPIP